MPLPIPQQFDKSFVDGLYKGKAMRQQLSTAKKEEELLDLQIDAFKNPKPDPKEQRAAMDFVSDAIAEAGAAAVIMSREGATPEEITATFDSTLSRTIPQEAFAEIKKGYDKNGDGIIGPRELAELEAFSIARGQELQEAEERTTNMKVLDDLVTQGHITKQQRNQYLEDQQAKAGTITGTTQFDPSQDPRTQSQQGVAHQENLDKWNQSSDVQEMIGSALPRVTSLPGAVGATGKIAIGAAGLFTTLGYEELAEASSQYFAGASPEEVSAVMAQLQAVRGELIPIVTGQESRARLSDDERRAGDRAVSLIEEMRGPADLAKSYPQVVGALRQFYEESWAEKYRVASRSKEINYPYDLNDRDEMVELADIALMSGLDDKSVRRLLTRLRIIQGIKID